MEVICPVLATDRAKFSWLLYDFRIKSTHESNLFAHPDWVIWMNGMAKTQIRRAFVAFSMASALECTSSFQ